VATVRFSAQVVLALFDTFLHGFELLSNSEVSEREACESADNKGEEEQKCLRHLDASKEDLGGDLFSILKNDDSHQSDDENQRAETNFFSCSHGKVRGLNPGLRLEVVVVELCFWAVGLRVPVVLPTHEGR
jgi:hypothetical protein